MASPTILRTIPMIGSMGMIGQRMIRIKLAIPPTMMISVPAKSKMSLDKKPIKRETRRSKNMWNLRSNDAELEAVSAEI